MDPESDSSDEKVLELFNRAVRSLPDWRRIPASTYRLQFNHRFTFNDATAIIPYLRELGITDCYASPYLLARRGSLHGYDILDHHRLNPEIGSEEAYGEFVEALRKHGMGQILDVVPNHMGISGNENAWWMDVLENGPSSPYADFFDIDWNPVKTELEDKVLLPILGEQYGRVLERQELTLLFEEGGFFIRYADLTLPVDPTSYPRILKCHIDGLEKEMEKDQIPFQELLSILTALHHLPPCTERIREKMMERQREKEIIKKRLSKLSDENGAVRSFILKNVVAFNGVPGDRHSFDLLDELLGEQVYRLAHWRVATEEINYRRFFDVNELAAIRVENPIVFRETHELIFKWVGEKKVTGLRVDHPDGLYNPVEYFYRLQKGCFVQICLHETSSSEQPTVRERIAQLYDEALSKNPSPSLRVPFYVVGEKILMKGEKMPEAWPILGTTGYGFLNLVNGVFIDATHAQTMDKIYRRFVRESLDYQNLVYEKKKLIMRTAMASEINTLGLYLSRISEKNRHTRDFTLNDLTTAIVEVIAHFPVYRTYVNQCNVEERDRRYIEQAVSKARRQLPALSATVFDFLEDVLLLERSDDPEESDRDEWLDFAMKFQQLTGPVMAKGVEDTVFYTYNRFVSLNEVGGNPDRFGTSLETFHGQNIETVKSWPYGLKTTSTHDTKRGEDVRARLNVLSEIPEEWAKGVMRWSRMNKKGKALVDGRLVPDRNEEYLLYQTLVGAWPNESMGEVADDTFRKRIKNYMLKAAREAKVNTSWISPNVPHEEALAKFIEFLLSPSKFNLFVRDFEPFRRRVATFGMFNSLSQTLLKVASPGVPDFYQGTEIWDFNLVDPDNRRPLDFTLRAGMLQNLKNKIPSSSSGLKAFHREMIQNGRDGSAKLYLIFKSLHYRRQHHRLFLEGSYLPLNVEGDLKNHVCGFARQWEDDVVLVVVPRLLTSLVRDVDEGPLGMAVWGNTHLSLPDEVTAGHFRNIFTEEMIQTKAWEKKGRMLLGEIFADFPVAMLERVKG